MAHPMTISPLDRVMETLSKQAMRRKLSQMSQRILEGGIHPLRENSVVDVDNATGDCVLLL
jgi:hypothetical protein